jgi:hypothetical protein
VIPPAVLEEVERAFLTVLRRDHPDASFIMRDLREGERPVVPGDLDVALKVRTSTPPDVNPVDSGAEDGAAPRHVEAIPLRPERPSRRKPRKAGG